MYETKRKPFNSFHFECRRRSPRVSSHGANADGGVGRLARRRPRGVVVQPHHLHSSSDMISVITQKHTCASPHAPHTHIRTCDAGLNCGVMHRLSAPPKLGSVSCQHGVANRMKKRGEIQTPAFGRPLSIESIPCCTGVAYPCPPEDALKPVANVRLHRLKDRLVVNGLPPSRKW